MWCTTGGRLRVCRHNDHFVTRLFCIVIFSARSYVHVVRSQLSLERRRLTFDLVRCYKIIHAHCNTTLEFARGCMVTRGNMYKMSKQNCTTDTTKYFLATVLLMCGIVFQILLWLPHHSMI